MSLLQAITTKFPDFMGKAVEQPQDPSDFEKFDNAYSIKIQMHYDMWKQRIRNASERGKILSNGWAFSTMSGLSCFESFVRYDETVKKIYFDKSGEIDRTLDEVAESLPKHKRKFSGAIIYGYGNLLRETYVIEQAKKAGILDVNRLYLLDCSLFYHLFAKSPLNPLRKIIRERSIKPVLLDFFEGETCRKQLVFIRDDLCALQPVLHLFLGNTFCNVDLPAIHKILDMTVRAGDVVIAEYANFNQEFLASMEADYVNQLATRAAAELFSIAEKKVVTQSIRVSDSAKALVITVPDIDRENTLSFQSMLRRKFQSSELTAGTFSLISSHHVLGGALNLDAYKRLPPAQS